jgi:hypothetical protein
VANVYKVELRIPTTWTATPGYDQQVYFHQDGPTGYVDVAASQGDSLQSVCNNAASHVLHPYGSAPTITTGLVDNRPACFVTPSADAPSQPARANGPNFQSAFLAVRYRAPLIVKGDQTQYQYLFVICDPSHLQAIAASVHIIGGY